MTDLETETAAELHGRRDSGATYLFAGGGTGGHLFPGIAVARELQARDPSVRIVFVGSTRTIEATIVAEHGLEHRTLPVEPLPTLKRNPFRFAWQNWQAWRSAVRMIRELRPTAVIGLGGFASAPVVGAASRRRITVILLEQNVIPGRTTRWLSRFADQICVSFAETGPRLRKARSVIVTGNPIRPEILTLHGLRRLQPSPSLELLILGGSQGADSLNAAVLAALAPIRDLFRDWTVVHQTGPRQVEQVRQTYLELGLTAVVEPFFHDMPLRYSSASLAVSRAGATTLAELSCAKLPMILLPFPHAADDHQRANAHAFVDHHAALVVEHASTNEITAGRLANALKLLIEDSDRRLMMGTAAGELARPDAARQIADEIIAVRQKRI